MCKNKLGTISVTSKIANQSKLSTTIYKDLKQAKLKILKRGSDGFGPWRLVYCFSTFRLLSRMIALHVSTKKFYLLT